MLEQFSKKKFIALYIWYLLHFRTTGINCNCRNKEAFFFLEKLWAPFKNIQSLGHE